MLTNIEKDTVYVKKTTSSVVSSEYENMKRFNYPVCKVHSSKKDVKFPSRYSIKIRERCRKKQNNLLIQKLMAYISEESSSL